MLTGIAEESPRYRLDARFGEVSTFNPNAVRGPHGIWNEESLPVLDWEDAVCRVVLPAWLQGQLRISTPVLRWSRAKRALVLIRHADAAPQVARLTALLNLAEWAGREPGDSPTWRVMFSDQSRWFQAVIGNDKLGRTNLITVHQLRPNQVVANMSNGWMVHREEK